MTLQKIDNLKLGEVKKITDENPDSLDFLQDHRYFKWIKLLCQEGNLEDFLDVLQNSKSDILAIMKYRRKLHQGDTKISFIELNTLYINNQFDKLHILLERLFLEPITESQFNFIIDKVKTKENGLRKIYDKHVQNKNLRILNIILTT